MSRRVLALAAAVLTVALAAAASAAGPNRVVGHCLHSEVRPQEIIVACADANALFSHLKWSSFGGATARATGDWSINDCKPYCAAGHFHDYPVSLTLSNPRRCPDGYRDYRTATAQYTSSRRGGKLGKLSLLCPLKG